MGLLTKFYENVQKFGNDIALTAEDEDFTYIDLNLKSDTICRNILKICDRGEKILLQEENSVDFICLMLGIFKAGCICIVSHCDFGEKVIAKICENEKVTMYIGKLSINCNCVSKNTLFAPTDSASIEDIELDNPLIELTSGTTGTPKAYLYNYECTENYYEHAKDVLNSYGISSHFPLCSLYFSQGIANILLCLRYGFRLIVLKDCMQYKNIFKVLNEIKLRNADSLIFPTSLFNVIVSNKTFLNRFPDTPKLMNVGGECIRLSSNTIDFFKQRKVVMIQEYGSTEAGGLLQYTVNFNRVIPEQLIPIGKAIKNVEARIVNDQDVEVLIGEIGVLKVKFNFHNAFVNSEWYVTSDCCYYDDDKNICIVGRNDDCYKVRGYRVDLSGIEAVMLHSDLVIDCAVIVIKDNNDTSKICLAVVTDKKIDEIRTHLKRELPDYMVPSEIKKVDKIPYNLNKKKDKITLRSLFV